ncbi:hypothetical protein ACOMHN_057591 [Nucella lapillus]
MKATALFTALATYVLVVVVESSSLPPQIQSGCMHEGKWYPEGSFQANPCSPCQCQGGRVFCAIVYCFPPPCVDAVRKPDHCCSTCPNGANCRAPDGSVISAGQSVQINADTTCSCPGGGHHMGFMGHSQALCLSKPPANTVTVPADTVS